MTHIRFEEEEEGEEDHPMQLAGAEQVSQAAGPTHLAAGTSGLLTPVCRHTTRVDNNHKNPAYVFRVVAAPAAASSSTLAASISSPHVVQLYNAISPQLMHVGSLQGHTNTITGLEFAHDTPSQLFTSSADSTVKAWDLRTGQAAHTFQAAGHEILCLGLQQQMIAAGGQGEVFFWDKRSSRLLTKMEDTHMEDVTQVKFCPSSSHHVVSASIDGLVAVHDTRLPLDHDDAFVAAINVGTSVEELGLYGQQQERMWVRTGTESLHLWEWGRTALDAAHGGEGTFAELTDAREVAAQTALQQGGPAGAAFTEGVHYIAGCHYDAQSQQLLMVAGQDGAVALWPLHEQACPTGSGVLVGASIGSPAMLLQGGHTAVVRSLVGLDQGLQGACCVTGGEDGQLCLWSLGAGLPSQTQVGTTSFQAAVEIASNSTPATRSPGVQSQHVHGGGAGSGGKDRRFGRGGGQMGHHARRVSPY